MQTQATEQNTAANADAKRMHEEFRNAEINYGAMQARDAHYKQGLPPLQSSSQMSGRYDAGQFAQYERLVMRALGDLRGELQTTVCTTQAQHQRFENCLARRALRIASALAAVLTAAVQSSPRPTPTSKPR